MINNFIHSKLFKQLFRFGVVGGLAFLIDAGLLYILTEFCHIYYLISSVISFIVSLAFNYVLSIIWVFDVKKKQTYKEVLLFTILSVVGLGINQLVMFLGVDKPGTENAANNHSDKFMIEDEAMKAGVKAHIIAAMQTKLN